MPQVNFYDAVYRLVRQVPPGKVVTYGQVATLLGSPRAARAVGYALSNLRDGLEFEVPWQRVINAQGSISAGGDEERGSMQRRLLEQEGIRFDKAGNIPLRLFLWEGPTRRLRDMGASQVNADKDVPG